MSNNLTHVKLSVGKGYVEADVPNCVIAAPNYMAPAPDEREEIRRALHNPIGTSRLCEIAKGKKSAAIVVNDITRPYPGGVMVEELADELHLAGLKDDQIFLVIAYGTHRKNTYEECVKMFGQSVVDRFRIVHHDALDESTLEVLGKTEGGVTCQVNKEFASAEVKITTGLICPHNCAGYSGGRKSIVPGISGMGCLVKHHSFPIYQRDPVFGWMDGNPFHEEALAAARIAGVDFILNIVNNVDHETVKAFAGDLDKAHREGTKLSLQIWSAHVPSRADVVISCPGGFPRDFDLHQAQKACSVAETVCKPGGHIIIPAEATDGAPSFGEILKKAKSPQEVVELFEKVGMQGGAGGNTGKAYMWARGLLKHKMSVCNTLMSKEELNEMFINHYNTLQEAIDDSIKIYGEDASFVVIPSAADMVIIKDDEVK